MFIQGPTSSSLRVAPIIATMKFTSLDFPSGVIKPLDLSRGSAGIDTGSPLRRHTIVLSSGRLNRDVTRDGPSANVQ